MLFSYNFYFCSLFPLLAYFSNKCNSVKWSLILPWSWLGCNISVCSFWMKWSSLATWHAVRGLSPVIITTWKQRVMHYSSLSHSVWIHVHKYANSFTWWDASWISLMTALLSLLRGQDTTMNPAKCKSHSRASRLISRTYVNQKYPPQFQTEYIIVWQLRHIW